GLPLGSVFPNVVSQVGATDPSLVTWVWAVNGTASVVGAILATGLALAVGFTGLGTAAVICYGLAALSTADLKRFRLRGDAIAEPLRLPGYPLFIAPLCVRGCSMWGITFVQAILVAILVVVVAKYAATLIGRRGGLIAAGLIALNPSFAFFGAHALSDVFGTTLMVG